MENDVTTSLELNKALVLKAFDTLFNKRDYVAAERFWSAHYIQHSAHIPPGRAGLFDRQGLARDAAVREPCCGGGRSFRHSRWTVQRYRPAGGVGRRRIVRMEDGRARRAQGRHPGRCHARAIAQRPADVRRPFPDLSAVAGIDAISRHRSHSVIFTNPCWTSCVVLAMASVLTIMPGKRSALPQW